MYKYRLYERHFAFCLFFHVCIIATSTTINSPLPFHGKRRRSPAAFLFGKPPICNASPTALRSARSPDVQLSDCDPAFVGRRKRTMKESHFCLGGINHHDILVHKKPTQELVEAQFSSQSRCQCGQCGVAGLLIMLSSGYDSRVPKGTPKLIMFSVRVHFLVQQF